MTGLEIAVFKGSRPVGLRVSDVSVARHAGSAPGAKAEFCNLTLNKFGRFRKLGVPDLGGPYNEDPTLGYYIGIPYFWKLSFGF